MAIEWRCHKLFDGSAVRKGVLKDKDLIVGLLSATVVLLWANVE